MWSVNIAGSATADQAGPVVAQQITAQMSKTTGYRIRLMSDMIVLPREKNREIKRRSGG
jgi:hypothetical protein